MRRTGRVAAGAGVSCSIAAGLAVAAGLLVALPKTGLSATAAHDPWKVQEVRTGTPIADAFGRCEACHSINTTEGEPGTSYISNTARTIQWIKIYKTPAGPFAPADSLACTFCHSTMLDNTVMEDALNEFTSPTIKHPMGRKVDGTTDTNNEWLSKIDSTPLADELRCIDCHSTALVTYPYHEGATTDPAGWTGTWNKTINKYALQNVVAAGDGDKKHCVDTCHGDLGAGNSATKPKMGHYTYGNFNGTTIYDPSGQAMQVAGSTCVICHDTHTSTKAGLIQDGLKRGSTDTGRTAINEGNCVTVCHAPGAFSTHGHGGKVGINSTTCTPCHTTSVRHRDQTDDASRRRLTYADPVKGNLTTNRAANGLDDDMDGLRDEADEATFAYSKTSNCQTCHINYAGHGSGTRDAACLDCHDMHGDDAAANNNAAMIRSTIFGESTVFTAADRAAGIRFRTATANGVCDNDACHGNISGALGTAHLGGPIDDATDCTGCHSFSHPADPAEPVASFKAVMNCNGCHSYPPITGDTIQTGIVKVVDHTIRSRDGAAGTSTNAAFLTAHNGCTLCHGTSGNATLDGFANTEAGGGGKDAYAGHRNASVEVNGISAPDNNVNANYSGTNGQCADACHSPGWVVGYATLPQTVYATGNVVRLQEYGSGSCNSCHGGGNNAAVRGNYWPDGQAAVTLNNEDRESSALRHEKHVEKLAAAVYGQTIVQLLADAITDEKQKKLCAYCHPDPFNSAFDPNGATSSFNDVHNNGTVNVGGLGYGHRLWDTYAAPFATTDGWTYTAGTPSTSWDGSCASVDCHDNKTTDTTTAAATTGYGWYDVTLTGCVMCHDDVTTTANATGQTHEAHVDATTTTRAAGGAITCSSCHPGAPVWGAPGTAPGSPVGTGHINGTLNGGGGTVTYTFTGTFPTSTCGVNVCHNNGQNGTNATNPYYWGTQVGGGTNTCVECHAATPATQAHTAHLSGSFGRAIACGDCHAAATANTHANGTVNFGGTVAFTYGVAADAVVGVNGGTFASCGTNNCHRADLANTAPLTASYPWNSAPLANCSICHADTAATLTSNAHDAHLGSNALPNATDVNECYACHNAVATSTGTLIAAGGHLDFDLTGDVTFNATYDYEAAGGTGVGGVSPAITCSDIRCHNGVGTPAWNTTATCGSCHNTGGIGPLPSAASVVGNHPEHANNDTVDFTDCALCHTNAASYTAGGGHADHMNLTVNVTMAGITYADTVNTAGGVNYNAAGADHVDNGTCTSTTGCHGAATLTGGWAAAATLATGCFECHNGTGSDVVATKPAVDTAPNTVNMTQYNTQGHGQAGPFPGSATTGPGYTYGTGGCYNCHDSGTAHAPAAPAADPFRLGAYAQNTDGMCLQGGACHDTTTEKTHSLAIVGGSATWPNGYAFKCVDCHDPHGDASYYMVRSHVSAPITTGDTGFGSDNYGTPQDTANASAVTFTNLTGNAANSYGVDGVTNGICEVCHVDTTNVQFYLRAGGANTHNAGLRCTGCHTHDKGFKGSCTDCHGSDTGENWPDGIANNATRSAYADDAGAHDAHVTAIGAAVPAAAGNGSCGYCHPGNPPTGHEMDSTSGVDQAEVIRMSTDGTFNGPPAAGEYWSYSNGPTATSGTVVYFKTLAGTDDTNAFFDTDSKTCSNISCHGEAVTPGWYGDLTPPVWSGGIQNIQVGDATLGGVLNITWNTATDAGSPPVSYILYRDTVLANVYTSPDATWTLTTNSYTDSGLSNGTTYYYGVKAIDSAAAQNATTATDTNGAAPSGTPGANTTDYYLTKNTGTLLYGATSTNGSACGTAWTVAQVTSTTWPVNGRGGLETSKTCVAASSTTNLIRMTGMSTATNWRNFVAFYKANTEANPVTVRANSVGNSFGFRGRSGTEDVSIWLAAVSSNGTHTTANSYNMSNIGSTAVTHLQPNLNALSVSVPAGSRLAVLFRWADVSTTVHSNDFMTVDNYNATILNRIRLTEISAETNPPSWTGGVSGLTVTDPGTSGELSISWNVATDATNPVSYRLYRSAAPDTNPLDNAYTTYGTTSIVDTGLTDGTVYYYHVKAVDNLGNFTANVDVVSGTPTAGGGSSCDTCHGAPPATDAHDKHANADAVYTDCDKCHGNATYSVSPLAGGGYTTSGPIAVHNNGSVDMYFARIPDANATFANVAAPNDICSNVDCHMSAPTPSWTTGSTNCLSCHAYPPLTGVNHGANLTVAPATLANFLSSHDDCSTCHGIKSATTDGLGAAVTHANYPAGSHGDGIIRMNGPDAVGTSARYVDTQGGCNNACHANDATYQMALSATRTVNFADFGGPVCSACHKAGGTGAIVTSSSPHLKVTVAGAVQDCIACHPGGTKGKMHAKNADANVVAVRNFATVGINYGHTVDAGITGFVLGGDNTTGTTEADICWNCHDQNANGNLNDAGDVSEWGTNTDTNGAAPNYNFGTLSQKSWLGATWTSGQTTSPSFAYKSAVINPDTSANEKRGSIHTANPSSLGGPTANYGDTVAQIRCSYCHDVHDTKAGSPTGKPYIRGAWQGNPYPEDGGPQSGFAYTNVTTWGPVPRGTPTGSQMGGYWIDQNSGNPAGAWTPATFGLLCELCHGNGDGSYTTAEIDALNQFGGGTTEWVSGLNGHRNAVKGGTLNDTVAARNIFAGRGGAINQYTMNTADHPFMNFDGTPVPGDTGNAGFRGPSSGRGYLPAMQEDRAADGGGWTATGWGTSATPSRALDLRGTIVNAGYHQFPCSKCHNPHASRLPRLMITNCLDTSHNTWDNSYQLNGTTDAVNQSRSISNWSSAQNCHRRGGVDPSDTRGDVAANTATSGNRGWNNLTPW